MCHRHLWQMEATCWRPGLINAHISRNGGKLARKFECFPALNYIQDDTGRNSFFANQHCWQMKSYIPIYEWLTICRGRFWIIGNRCNSMTLWPKEELFDGWWKKTWKNYTCIFRCSVLSGILGHHCRHYWWTNAYSQLLHWGPPR